MLCDALIPIAIDTTRYVVEVVEPDFYGMPKYIWDGIFVVFDVLIVGLLLAFIASKYQHRKEIEWKLRGNLLEKRIESYQKVSSFIYCLQDQHYPTTQEEKEIVRILNYPKLTIPIFRYADIFASEDNLRTFIVGLDALIASEKLFLDYQTLRHLENMQFYFSEMSAVLERFIIAENNPSTNFRPDQIKHHIDIGLKAYGVAINNDMSKWFAMTDQLLAAKLRTLSLAPKRYLTLHLWDKLIQNLTEWVHKRKSNSSLLKLCIRLDIGKWDFFQIGEMIFLVLIGTHYMDQETPIQDVSHDEAIGMIEEFVNLYNSAPI